jgi:hypothetical protein
VSTAFAEVKDAGVITPILYAPEAPVTFDTFRMGPNSGQCRDVVIGNKIMGPTDDTLRVFIANSATPREQAMYTDTTTVGPIIPYAWRRDVVASGSPFSEAAAIGDADNDGQNEFFFGSSTSPYRLARAYWSAGTWVVETIAYLTGTAYVRDIVVGDADNDASNEIIFEAGYDIMCAKWNSLSSSWDTVTIWDGTSNSYGVDIGNADPTIAGNEVYIATYGQQFVQAYWTGSAWTANVIDVYGSDADFYDLAVGDFMPNNPGDEIAINNGYNYSSHGNIFTYFNDGTSWWRQRWTVYTGWSSYGQIAIGKPFDFYNGNVIVATQGGSSTGKPVALWNDGTNWYYQFFDNPGGTSYGIAVGNVDKWRTTSKSPSDELVITGGASGSSRPYLYEQAAMNNDDVGVAGISFLPDPMKVGDSATVRLTIMNTGYNTQDTIPVFYITPAKAVVEETCFAAIAYGSYYDFDFATKYYVADSATVAITCSTALAGDEYTADDVGTANLKGYPTLAGNYTVGTADANYATITEAVASWNACVITGDVTFTLTDASYSSAETFPITINAPVAYSGGDWTLTIKPSATEVQPVITGSSTSQLFDLYGCARVIFDGAASGTSKDMTITNTGTGKVFRIGYGASYCVVKNCVLEGNSTTSTNPVVNLYSGAHNTTIENCDIKAGTGNTMGSAFYFYGSSSEYNTDNLIKGCNIYDWKYYGIYMSSYNSNTTITECNIYTVNTQSNTYMYGIYNTAAHEGLTITKNRIGEFFCSGASPALKGIYVSVAATTGVTTIANNMIFFDVTTTHVDADIWGIDEYSTTGANFDIYYNSVYIGGSEHNSADNSYCYARRYATNMNFKNNIGFNNRTNSMTGTGKHYGFYASNTDAGLVSDHNDLYAPNPSGYVGLWSTTDCATLGEWQTASGGDANSISANPGFAAVPDLHISTTSNAVNRGGTPVSITDDFDGETRDATYPDMGADEYTPNAVGAPTLVSPASNAVNVSLFGDLVWTAGSMATHYDVYLDVVDPPVNKVSAMQTGLTYPYSGLPAATMHYWKVVAWNDTLPLSDASSAASGVDSFTTATPPNDPTNLAISNIAVDGMDLTWTDNSTDEDSFLIYMSLDGSAYNWFAANDPDDNTYSATGLNPNIRYYWRVTAYNNITGESNFTAADSWTLAEVPGAPTLTEVLWTSIRITLALGNNPTTTDFVVRVVYDDGTDASVTKYVDPTTGALSATEVWGDYTAFGGAAGKKVIRLPYATSITFDVKARNGALYETNYGTSNSQSTLAALSMPFSEDFELPGFPPVGWDTALVYYPGTGTVPVFAKTYYGGDSCVRFNSSTGVSGSMARIWTMPISLGAVPTLSFDFYHSTSFSTSFDSLYIQVSTDNGVTWNDVEGFQRYRSTSGWEIKTVSLNAYANSTILLGFLGVSKYGSYLYFDDVQLKTYRDVQVSAITVPPSVEATIGADPITPQVTVLNNGGVDEDVPVIAEIWSAQLGLSESFDDATFPPVGWDTVRIYGTSSYNAWSRVTSGSSPTCSPHSGTAMAKYYSMLCPADQHARLISPWMAVQASDAVSFWMYHNDAYTSAHDSIVVEITTDGVNFDRLEMFDRYSTTNDWQNHNVSLASYAGNSARIVFHAYSAYGNSMYLDDVVVGTYTPAALVYADTTTVFDLPNLGGFDEAYFDEWTPPASGDYTFKAFTALVGDMNTGNDLMSVDFTVDMTPPDVPTLVSPTDASTVNATPEFEWGALGDAVEYNLVVDDGVAETDIDINTPNTTYTHPTPLEEDLPYTWKVRAKDAYDNWSDFQTTPWAFSVDATPPAIPTPIAPAESSLVVDETQTFVWNFDSDVAEYELVVEEYVEPPPPPPEPTYLTSDTTYATNLPSANYTWKVRAKDAVDNWSDYSPAVYFTLELPAWVKLADEVPQATDVKPGKRVKDGGSMIALGSDFYLFPGNKSRWFMTYTPGLDSPFVLLETIPDTYKYKYGVGPDPEKIAKNKKIKKGAALCYDGEATIYATKGGGLYEFWAYDMTTETIPHPNPESVQYILPHWEAKAYVPTVKGLKGGTSMAWLNGKLYLLAGSQKSGNPFFFSYDPAGDTALGTPWTTLTPPGYGPFSKLWKDGSAITTMNGLIYALKGKDKYNPLWVYDPSQDTLLGTPWLELESIPLGYPISMIAKPKKVKVGDGGALTTDGAVLYAIKGGGKQDFWMYTPAYDTLPGTWTPLCTIPKGLGGKKMVPKTGAALAYANNYVWLMKGNNNAELWRYNVFAKDFAMTRGPRTIASSMVEHTNATSIFSLSVTPNPFTNLAVVRYTVPVTGKVSIKLYNSAGRLSETLLNENLNAGTYTMNLNANTLAKGVYFLKFENGSQASEVKLIVQ